MPGHFHPLSSTFSVVWRHPAEAITAIAAAARLPHIEAGELQSPAQLRDRDVSRPVGATAPTEDV